MVRKIVSTIQHIYLVPVLLSSQDTNREKYTCSIITICTYRNLTYAHVFNSVAFFAISCFKFLVEAQY